MRRLQIAVSASYPLFQFKNVAHPERVILALSVKFVERAEGDAEALRY